MRRLAVWIPAVLIGLAPCAALADTSLWRAFQEAADNKAKDGSNKDAIQLYKSALKQAKSDGNLQEQFDTEVMLAKALSAMGRFRESDAELVKALDAIPPNRQPQARLASLAFATNKFSEGNLSDCQEILTALLSKLAYDEQPPALDLLAKLYDKQGKKLEADAIRAKLTAATSQSFRLPHKASQEAPRDASDPFSQAPGPRPASLPHAVTIDSSWLSDDAAWMAWLKQLSQALYLRWGNVVTTSGSTTVRIEVTGDRYITATVIDTSGSGEYDDRVLAAVNSLNSNPGLTFPIGKSKVQHIAFEARFKSGDTVIAGSSP